MENKYFIILILMILGIFPLSFAQTLDQNVSVNLISNKQVYVQGEDINLTLKIENLNNQIINGQIKGKIIVGDIGYEIQCFDYNAPANKSNLLGLSPIPASFSNSNKKTMTTLYACDGTQMQSSKTMMDNTPIIQSGSENFELGPFTYSYSLNGTDYDIKSNILNITVTSQNQQQQQQQESQNQEQANTQNSQSQQAGSQSPESQNSQSQQEGTQSTQNQQNQGLNSQNQQSLANNQQNAQSVNQLKKDIANANKNPLESPLTNPDKENFWIWFFLLICVILISSILYFKYLNKNEEESEIVEEKIIEKIPDYILLLNKLKGEKDEKNKAKFLSQAVRNFIGQKNKINEDLTHSDAIKYTKNELFINILRETEAIEFAGKKLKLDYKHLEKQLRGEFK